MAEEIVLKLEVDNSDAGRSLSSLRQEFKSLQKELDNTTIGSKKYVDTLSKLGKVRDEIGDLNQVINAMHPEGKIQALQSVVGGVASGFQAATAAAALFGNENEDLTKTLVKVQSAMAFADGIKGVMELGKSFEILNIIIAANPIMAIVTGVTLLTAAVYGLVEAQEDELATQKELYEVEKKRAKLRSDEVHLAKFLRDLETDKLEHSLDVAKARGDSAVKLYELEKKLLHQRIADLKYIQATGVSLTKEEALQLRNLYFQLEILEAQETKRRQDAAEKRNEERVKNEKEAFDKSMAELDKYMAEAERIDAIDEKNRKEKLDREAKYKRDVLQGEADWEMLLNKEVEDDNKLLADNQQKRIQENFQAALEVNSSLMALNDFVFTDRLSKAKKGSAEEKKILKQQFEIQKQFNIAQAVINGAQSILAITRSAVDPTGLTTALRIAAQAALTATTIAKISSQQFNAGGGGEGATSTAVSMGTTPRLSSLTTNPNVISGQSNGGTMSTEVQTQSQTIPVRAYVVESDISTSQANARTIRQRAAFS